MSKRNLLMIVLFIVLLISVAPTSFVTSVESSSDEQVTTETATDSYDNCAGGENLSMPMNANNAPSISPC